MVGVLLDRQAHLGAERAQQGTKLAAANRRATYLWPEKPLLSLRRLSILGLRHPGNSDFAAKLTF